ncbi:hypothetical protein GCM10009676_01890 [Prauserella halophila]|uniref:Uncharacterized protein n=1 Tax=Prauserella halophila TaxID=185641 RepID=A0ABN1VXT0_9PSEU
MRFTMAMTNGRSRRIARPRKRITDPAEFSPVCTPPTYRFPPPVPARAGGAGPSDLTGTGPDGQIPPAPGAGRTRRARRHG